MLLSVIIPSYNRAAVLPQAIESVFDQDVADLEIIVVDDASRDNTSEVIAAIKDPRIVYIRHERNKGGSAARNTGLANARGQYVAFLDSDDTWMPQKLGKQLSLFDSLDDSYGVVYTGLKVIYEATGQTVVVPATRRGKFLNELLIANYISTLSSAMVRRKYIDMVGGFDANLRSCQDWDFYIRLMKECKFECLEEPLTVYYINKKDPTRISNSGASIVQGHAVMARKFKDDYQKLSRDERIRYYESIAEMYNLGGSFVHSAGMMIKAFALTGRPKYLDKILRYAVRYFRQRIQKTYGY